LLDGCWDTAFYRSSRDGKWYTRGETLGLHGGTRITTAAQCLPVPENQAAPNLQAFLDSWSCTAGAAATTPPGPRPVMTDTPTAQPPPPD
jgi:hypothetical protein